jgi:hypothetical protein
VNPSAVRVGILVVELVVFFIVTAFTAHFISYASALEPAEGAPPPQFPVLVYEGDRAKPAPAGYRMVTWSEWEKTAESRPGATLLLPERAATVSFGERGEASFTAAEMPGSRQSVELRWRTGGGEQQARYVAHARGAEAKYLRTLGTQTLLMAAAVGFITGLFTGRAMRRRWLAVPGTLVPPSR